jgi:hypothetical protein
MLHQHAPLAAPQSNVFEQLAHRVELKTGTIAAEAS